MPALIVVPVVKWLSVSFRIHSSPRRSKDFNKENAEFEVFPSLAAATNVANKIATSQIALPKATCDLVYATTGYEQSITNLAQVSLASDTVFTTVLRSSWRRSPAVWRAA